MKKQLIYILLSLTFALIGFPNLVSLYDLTVDPQIHWVFNSLFHNEFDSNQKIIFPHGPLSFLEFPLGFGNNIVLSSLFLLLIRFLFAFVGLHFFELEKKWSAILTLLLVFLFLQYLDFELLVCGLVFLLVAHHLKNKNHIVLILAVLISAISFYIKISIGVISGTILGSYFIYLILNFLRSKNKTIEAKSSTRNAILLLLFYPFILFTFWLILYKTGTGFLTYIIGVKELIIGNSDSASLYPDNNWLFLSFSMLALLPFAFFLRNSQNKMLILMSILSVLAVWKHSMAREDAWHIMKYFYWLFFIAASLLVNEKKINIPSKVCILLALGLFYLNARSVTGFSLLNLKSANPVAFFENVFSEKSKKDAHARIKKESATCLLDPRDRNKIANNTVDCYPYNYCFLESNNLLWSPRPIIQSYAAYTPWLDNKNAEHFLSEDAPQFIIWENDILQRDRWNAAMTSIDGRYLLHDEPLTVKTIFANYDLIRKRQYYTLWEKQDTPTQVADNVYSKSIKLNWNEWISIPSNDQILYAKAHFSPRFLSKLKSIFYKSEAVFIEYKTTYGTRKYKLTQKHASNGILISPLLGNLNNDDAIPHVLAIRFTTHNKNMFSEKINVQWSTNNPSSKQYVSTFHKKLSTTSLDSIIISTEESGNSSLEPNQYSPSILLSTADMQLASTDSIQLVASLHFNMPCLANAKLVLEILNGAEQKSWESISLDKFLTHCNTWESTYHIKTTSIQQGDLIKAYIWNNGQKPLLYKDFKLTVIKHNE